MAMRQNAIESLYEVISTEQGVRDRSFPGNMVVRPLLPRDAQGVLELETLAFPEAERATLAKIEYRLRVCPELCAGVFVREFQWDPSSVDNAPGGSVAYPRTSPMKERLVAQIIATKMIESVVTDKTMEVPKLGEDGYPVDPEDPRGHQEAGRYIGIHSLAVDPEFQGKGLGYLMLKDYVERFYTLHTADGIALLAHDELLPFYHKHGFQDQGISKCTFGNTTWHDLYLPFDTYDNRQLA